MPTRIPDLPDVERPRERLLARGVEALSERELLALILRSGRPGESALDLAATLITEEGGLAGLAALRPEELARVPGVGVAKAAALVAAFRLGRLADGLPTSVVLRSAEDVSRIATQELGRLPRERVIVFVCDGANRLKRVVPISEGSIDRAMLPVREILNAVLRHDGRGFAVAHNHPSGNATASDNDLRAAALIVRGAEAVGLRVLDQLIVSASSWAVVPTRRESRATSMAAHG